MKKQNSAPKMETFNSISKFFHADPRIFFQGILTCQFQDE